MFHCIEGCGWTWIFGSWAQAGGHPANPEEIAVLQLCPDVCPKGRSPPRSTGLRQDDDCQSYSKVNLQFHLSFVGHEILFVHNSRLLSVIYILQPRNLRKNDL